MLLKQIYHTFQYLKLKQLIYQLKYRLYKPKYRRLIYTKEIKPIDIFACLDKFSCLDKGKFCFLNITDRFNSWNDISKGMLWAYNLNYMDYLNQEGILYREGKEWIDKFIEEVYSNKIGLDPYPIALRGINWIKFISAHRECIDNERLQRWNNCLYSQYVLLYKKLEYYLLGNHLLEDAFSLFIASLYFQDFNFYKKSIKLLHSELQEQILPDGAHFEQSPMYHCILLERLLDCYNFSISNSLFDTQSEVNELLKHTAKQMLGHLQAITLSSGKIPLLNDSAYGIAPSADDIFAYAVRLRINWDAIPMRECGYRYLHYGSINAVIDVGNIAASYQPGHTHADVFNYELYFDDEPIVVDTGISTYNKTVRRQYERSTAAHNTVSVGEGDMNEVWDGFRVGKRANVTLLVEKEDIIQACHDGYGKDHLHTRTFYLCEQGLSITDEISSKLSAASYIHLSPGVKILSNSQDEIKTNKCIITIEGAKEIIVYDDFASCEYNTLVSIKVVKILFEKYLHYKITSVQKI